MIRLSSNEQIELYGDRIAVRPIPDTVGETVSGLVLPDTSKRTPVRGEVVSAGPRSRLSVGSTILYRPRVGTVYEIGAEEYMVMGDRDVVSVIAPA